MRGPRFREKFSKGKAGGYTLVEIVIVIAIIFILASIAVPGLFRARLTANDSAARTTLKALSNACEIYAAGNFGRYPTAITDLTTAVPPYLYQDYTAATRSGYDFNCTVLTPTGYSCTATPASCNVTGTKVFTITTDGVLAVVDCS